VFGFAQTIEQDIVKNERVQFSSVLNALKKSHKTKNWQGFVTCVGRCDELSQVRVGVEKLIPAQNLYPQHGLAGTSTVQQDLRRNFEILKFY
jgi:hypothetical protein